MVGFKHESDEADTPVIYVARTSTTLESFTVYNSYGTPIGTTLNNTQCFLRNISSTIQCNDNEEIITVKPNFCCYIPCTRSSYCIQHGKKFVGKLTNKSDTDTVDIDLNPELGQKERICIIIGIICMIRVEMLNPV